MEAVPSEAETNAALARKYRALKASARALEQRCAALQLELDAARFGGRAEAAEVRAERAEEDARAQRTAGAQCDLISLLEARLHASQSHILELEAAACAPARAPAAPATPQSDAATQSEPDESAAHAARTVAVLQKQLRKVTREVGRERDAALADAREARLSAAAAAGDATDARSQLAAAEARACDAEKAAQKRQHGALVAVAPSPARLSAPACHSEVVTSLQNELNATQRALDGTAAQLAASSTALSRARSDAAAWQAEAAAAVAGVERSAMAQLALEEQLAEARMDAELALTGVGASKRTPGDAATPDATSPDENARGGVALAPLRLLMRSGSAKKGGGKGMLQEEPSVGLMLPPTQSSPLVCLSPNAL